MVAGDRSYLQISWWTQVNVAPEGGCGMRAFRPSQFATAQDLDEEGARAKQENLSLYKTLAKLSKPLFDLAAKRKKDVLKPEAPQDSSA